MWTLRLWTEVVAGAVCEWWGSLTCLSCNCLLVTSLFPVYWLQCAVEHWVCAVCAMPSAGCDLQQTDVNSRGATTNWAATVHHSFVQLCSLLSSPYLSVTRLFGTSKVEAELKGAVTQGTVLGCFVTPLLAPEWFFHLNSLSPRSRLNHGFIEWFLLERSVNTI